MTEIFSHIGAWSPKPEQNAVAKYFNEYELIGEFISNKINQYSEISDKICSKLDELKEKNYKIDYQKPEGGIYISIYLEDSIHFDNVEDYTKFLIESCGVGLVPFEYFGTNKNRGWFRLSMGGIDLNNIEDINIGLEKICINSRLEVMQTS
jgi:aspartate aminotransferase